MDWLHEGGMARLGSGRLLKIGSIDQGMAECIWFDHRGQVHVREYEIGALQPFWLSSSPKSIWPEINELPDEVVQAADALAAARRRERARKPKPSNRVRRRQL